MADHRPSVKEHGFIIPIIRHVKDERHKCHMDNRRPMLMYTLNEYINELYRQHDRALKSVKGKQHHYVQRDLKKCYKSIKNLLRQMCNDHPMLTARIHKVYNVYDKYVTEKKTMYKDDGKPYCDVTQKKKRIMRVFVEINNFIANLAQYRMMEI